MTDDEIRQAVRALYNQGLVVEPSGSAGIAALINGYVPDIDSKNVVVVLTGRNIAGKQLTDILYSF